jgi:hypothetical protein
MSRGNQREIDRARAQARNAKHAPGQKKEGTPQQRNEADAAALALKLAAKKAKAEADALAGAGGGGGGGKL